MKSSKAGRVIISENIHPQPSPMCKKYVLKLKTTGLSYVILHRRVSDSYN